MGLFAFCATLGAALFMTGLIWFVQIVHYPLFALVDRKSFTGYEADHARRTAFVVAPAMVVEGSSAILLLSTRPSFVNPAESWGGLLLLLLIWISTVSLQAPLHRSLSTGFTAAVHRRLVIGNWLRTAAWTGRSILLLWCAGRGFSQ